jgi:hypothetical protein
MSELMMGRCNNLKRTSKPKCDLMSNYQKLDAWKESMELVKEIYLETKKFPKEELYGITSQARRASVSIPSNIAKGWEDNIKKIPFNLFMFPGALYMNWKRC